MGRYYQALILKTSTGCLLCLPCFVTFRPALELLFFKATVLELTLLVRAALFAYAICLRRQIPSAGDEQRSSNGSRDSRQRIPGREFLGSKVRSSRNDAHSAMLMIIDRLFKHTGPIVSSDARNLSHTYNMFVRRMHDQWHF